MMIKCYQHWHNEIPEYRYTGRNGSFHMDLPGTLLTGNTHSTLLSSVFAVSRNCSFKNIIEMKPSMMLNGQVRIAVIGAGWWTQGWHLPHLSRNPISMIAAIVDASDHPKSNLNPNLISLQELATNYNAPIYSSIEELLQDEHVSPSLDGVLVATPHATHFAIGKLLMEEATRRHNAGEKALHIMMEKPMTTDFHEAQKLHSLVEEYRDLGGKGSFMINHSANYRLQTRKAKELVMADAIGDIRHITAFFASPLMWIFDDPDNKGWNEPQGNMQGNGFAWGQSCHLLGWIFQVCPNLVPEAVFCAMNNSEKTGADIAHAATIICKGNAIMSVSGTTLLPGNAHSNPPVGKKIFIHIYGTKGALLYDGNDLDCMSGKLELRQDAVNDGHPKFPCGEEVGFDFENIAQNGNGPESIQAFLDACSGKNDYYIGADSMLGLRTVQTMEAMYRSNASKELEQVLS